MFATREEVYGLTRALSCHTDFGHRCPPLRRPLDEIVADAGSALARCLDDDFDLGAEGPFTWAYTRTPWSPVAAFGLHVRRDVGGEVGYLASTTLRSEESPDRPGRERTRYYFKEAHHSVCVMGLLTAATLAHGTGPGPPLAEHPDGTQWADRLRELVPASLVGGDLRRAHRFSAGAPVPFLAEGAVRTGEFDRLAGVLSAAPSAMADLALEPTQAVEQGVELLHRLSAAAAGPCAPERVAVSR
ncbi:MAG: hypothetical protein M0Z51_09045 [Propionibacterium sp.]|nr:hypothetical protein [Propionibacterium sp.]